MTSIEDFTSQYGLVQKIDAFGYLDYLKKNPDAPRKHGKVVLVTADTPLKASRGEGKTTTTIALIDALRERGIDAAAVLRQPSMGITAAGSKGGASGGGKASLTHPELIDWGLCGEMGAIEAAQNLLVSFAEKAVDDGKLDTILVPRVSEVPSRSLRQIAVDRGKGDVAERVVLTPTCELMQIVVLSRSMDEISERVAKMVAGTKDGKAVTFGEFVDLWRITGILGDAVKPAKTETVNGSPVYVHGGPFANVSIGIPTLVSVEMACALHVVTRASTWRDDPDLAWRYPFHVQRLEGLDIPTFPLINLWDGEDDQIPALKDTAKELEFRDPIIGNLYRDGGDALAPQLDAFVDAVTNGSMPAEPHSHKGMALVENVRWVAEHAYGVPADRVILKDGFAESLQAAEGLCASAGIDFGSLALVAVKSPATMTDNDRAPEAERTVTLKKVEVHSGAGLVHVNLTTSLTTPMPKIV